MAAHLEEFLERIYMSTIVEPKQKLSVAERLKAEHQPEQDFLPLKGTDYVEFYVGNAKQAAHYYKTALVFKASPMPVRKPASAIARAMSFDKTN